MQTSYSKIWPALLLALSPSPLSAQQAQPFSPAVRAGDILYLSGQIGQVPPGMDPKGDGFDAAVRESMDAIGKILKSEGLGYGHLVKCTVMLDDMANWPRFNEIYVSYFKGLRLPARSAFGADGLARGAPVEVECIAHTPR